MIFLDLEEFILTQNFQGERQRFQFLLNIFQQKTRRRNFKLMQESEFTEAMPGITLKNHSAFTSGSHMERKGYVSNSLKTVR